MLLAPKDTRQITTATRQSSCFAYTMLFGCGGAFCQDFTQVSKN